MALQDPNLYIGQNNRELKPHGTPDFPCAGYKSEANIQWHWHEETELIAVHSGKIKLKLTNGTYELSAGDGVFINTNTLHCIELLCEGTVLHSLVFSNSLIYGSRYSVFARKYVFPISESYQVLKSILLRPDTPWQKNTLTCIENAYCAIRDDNPGYEFEVRENLSRFWYLMFINTQIQNIISQNTNNDSVRIKQMLRYIHVHYGEQINVSLIASAANVGERECMRCFNRTISISPTQYLLKYRMGQASYFLRTSMMTVSEVASACGFNNSCHFAKTFKKYFNCTPSEYRKKYK